MHMRTRPRHTLPRDVLLTLTPVPRPRRPFHPLQCWGYVLGCILLYGCALVGAGVLISMVGAWWR